jgi:hypothetical protein
MMLRRLAVGIATVLFVLIGNVAPAAADTVTIRWTCASVFGQVSTGDFRVTVTAPATASAGQTVTVTAAAEATWPNPSYLAPGAVQATMEVELGGVSAGRITLTGLTNPEIQPGTPWRIGGGSGQVTLANRGQVSFHPVLINAGSFRCGKTAPPYPVADTTQVS